MTTWRRLIPLLLTMLCTAQATQARVFQPLGATRGLEARVVPALLVDRDGVLWVGSREGLYRYDGYQATWFAPDPSDANAISDLDVRTLYEGRDRVIWVGTNTGGLNRYDRDTGRFTRFRHASDASGSLPDDSVYAIAEDARGQLWVGTQQGLGRLDAGSGRFEVFRHAVDDPTSLSHDWAFALHLGPGGHLWIATVGGGLNRWVPDAANFERFDLAGLTGGSAKLNDVFTIHEDTKGRLWLGTREGLVVLDPAAGTARYVDMGEKDGYRPLITAMWADDRDRLWLGTMIRGVLVVDLNSGEWRALTDTPLGEDGNLPAQPQMSIAGSAGQAFIGTWGEGVFRTAVDELDVALVDLDRTGGALRNENISSVMPGDVTGRPWLGSFGGGPQQVDVAAGTVVVTPATDNANLRESGVLDLAPAGDNTTWAATTQGLFRFGPDGDELDWFRQDAGDESGIGAGYAYAVLPDATGGLWLGMGGSGLYHRPAGSPSFRRWHHDPAVPGSLGGDFVTALLEARPGHVWVGTRSNGLNRCRVEAGSCERFPASPGAEQGLRHHHVTDLFRDRRGRVWVATDGGGLHRILLDEQHRVTGFEHFGRAEGLLNDGIMAIAEDQDESLWLSTRHGLSRFHPDTGRSVNFVTESGLPASHFNTGAAASDGGWVYFGSVSGLIGIRKGALLTERTPAPVHITRVQTAARGEAPRPLPPGRSRLEVAYGDIVTVEFASLDYSESAHEYEYRLGADDGWTPLGSQHQIIFHGLAPGEYRFQARGRDVHGRWGESSPIAIQIVPPFWMTAWFRTTMAVMAVLLALALHRINLARLRRRAQEIQRLGEKRESALETALGNRAELSVLTPRQKEVLQLVAEGYATREIADLLDVSVKTVEAHRANLMERLDIHDVPGLVRLAIRAGLVSPHE